MNNQKIRILFFIGSLKGGGKERRLIELLSYLTVRDHYELMVVVTDPTVHYAAFYDLKINYRVILKKWKRNDLSVFYSFYKICKQFKPGIIHTWGRVQSFYALPAVIGQRIPLVNGQITNAPTKASRWSLNRVVDRINFIFSTIILANSQAGAAAYKPPPGKIKVIYNGINLSRCENLPAPEDVKAKYGIITPFAVVMVASFKNIKNYRLFFSIAEQITKTRNDITFVAVGDTGDNSPAFRRFYEQASRNRGIIITGRIDDVEAVVNCCTVGVLFSSTEGLSNAVIEYMSLARPVIANDAGGTKELVHHYVNGYLISDQSENEIVKLITGLIDDPEKCTAFGKAGRKIIEESFSLEKMGKSFEQTYRDILGIREPRRVARSLYSLNEK